MSIQDVNSEHGGEQVDAVTLTRVNNTRVDVRTIVARDPDRREQEGDHHIRVFWHVGDAGADGFRPQASLVVRQQPGVGYVALLERVLERILADGRVEVGTEFGEAAPLRLLAIPEHVASVEGLTVAYEAALATLRFRARSYNSRDEVLRYFTPTGRPAPSGRYRG